MDATENDDGFLFVVYTALTILALDLVIFTVGTIIVYRLQVRLDRTLKLALVVTGFSLLLKLVYNILLFSTNHKMLFTTAL